MTATTVPYEEVRDRLLADPEVRQAYEELEPAYQVARLRIMRGLTQQQLAGLVGTKQPSIARLESGKSAPTLVFLQRVVEALGGRLTVRIETSWVNSEFSSQDGHSGDMAANTFPLPGQM